ncbi:MAG TPA: hypothetical protein VFX78_13785 [Candidatus Eisenbacteria bacterium]|nr:hypothetical protein [Candidatus Eisenbacteria bacterium]
MTVRTINTETGAVGEHTKFWSVTKSHDTTEGAPSQGEANVERVARAFMAAVNRDCGATYDRFTCASAGPEMGHDCEIGSSVGGPPLKLQVTRALPSDAYRGQRILGRRDLAATVDKAAEWLMDAIRRKATTAAPDVVLVIDALDAPQLSMFADAETIARNRAQLDAQKWHSIWVCGSSWANRLAGRPLAP